MRRSLVGLAIVVAVLGIGAAAYFWLRPSAAPAEQSRQIVIASIVEIQPIAELRTGFREVLDASSLNGSITYVERNAQGDAALIAQIAAEVARTTPALVYVLGTPLAQAIQQRAPDVTVVQGAVTDPVAAGLADSWLGSGRKYAANSDSPPVERIVALLRQLRPDARTVGVLYNPGESNSVAVVTKLKDALAGTGLSLREFNVTSASDISAATTAAVNSADVLFVPPDNIVTGGMQGIVQAASNRRVAVFATTADAVRAGALAAVTTDFTDLGRQAGRIALQILVDGRDPATMPIAVPDDLKIVVSRRAAQLLGVPLDIAAATEFTIVE